MRHVKLKGHEPGVRRDLLTGQDIYSSRFLSAEEHFPQRMVADVWCWIVGVCIGLPALLRRELGIRWDYLNFAEAFFVCCGIIAAVAVGVVVGLYG